MSAHDHTFRFVENGRKCEFVVWWSGDETYALDCRRGIYDDVGDWAVYKRAKELFYEKYGSEAKLRWVE